MEYGLPKSVEIGGTKFEIRYDFRVILEIFEALNDPAGTCLCCAPNVLCGL